MIFRETALPGAYTVDLERREDERGFFARAFCLREYAARGLEATVVQSNVAYSARKGTVRGMHFQYPPQSEVKIVRATRGAVLDVIVDLRPESPTYLRHAAVRLSAEDHRALYVPERFAHGYQTLEDGSEVWYDTTGYYAPEAEGGLSPFDPRLALPWPLAVSALSARDAGWRRLDDAEAEVRRRMEGRRA